MKYYSISVWNHDIEAVKKHLQTIGLGFLDFEEIHPKIKRKQIHFTKYDPAMLVYQNLRANGHRVYRNFLEPK
jgi:hypothetical protein